MQAKWLTRKAGFYWVKINGDWTIGKFRPSDNEDPAMWFVIGESCWTCDNELDEIIERPILMQQYSEAESPGPPRNAR